jgi:hypothetical protein
MIRSLDEIVDDLLKNKKLVPFWLQEIYFCHWALECQTKPDFYLEFMTCFLESAQKNLHLNPNSQVHQDSLQKARFAEIELTRRQSL